MTHEVELAGCTPEPLMHYLKSLGVLRLVCEQADAKAAGCWRNDRFVLRSVLDESSLVDFFLHKYRPSPILTPWAGGSGFFEKDNHKAVDAIEKSSTPRLEVYRECIRRVKTILANEGVKQKPSSEVKARLLRRYRGEMPDEFVRWMDAAMVIQADDQTFAPLLGTGGNDGRLDFAQNFMQRLVDQLNFTRNGPRSHPDELLRNALFAEPVAGLSAAAVGQFAPGRAGGPNATQGMEGDSTDNPWDFVLMLEGTLLFAGALVRRAGIYSGDKAAFPFTVRPRPIGGASSSDNELGAARGEMWLPLWSRFAGLGELQLLLAEGRADYAGHPARDTLDFARAVAQLGIDRGVEQFTRFGFFQRSGKAYLAVAMDRFAVPKGPRADVELLRELDVWLESFRKASTSNSPARFQVALSAIESAIFDYCRYGRPEDLRNLFVALGKAERALAITCGRYQNRTICQPLANLSRRWVEATYDGSHEYHIAWALSRIGDTNAAEKVPFFRAHLEPVSWEKGRWNWQQNRGPEVVWQSADLATNMVNVLQRRIVGAANQSHPFLPIPSYRGASIHDIAAFLADGYCDDNRIEELLWALVLVDHRKRAHISSSPARVDDFPLVLPRQYALLKLLFLPGRLVAQPQNSGGPLWRLERRGDAGVMIKPEPRIIPLLLADRVAEACRLASARIRASGLCPMPSPMAGYPSRMADWEPPPHSYLDGRRLAASLLIPITDAALNQLVTMVVRPDEERDE